MSLLTDFFKPVPTIEGISDVDYESLRHYVVTLEATARMIDLSYYIIDYKKPRYRANLRVVLYFYTAYHFSIFCMGCATATFVSVCNSFIIDI
jgi:hypothetical protein